MRSIKVSAVAAMMALAGVAASANAAATFEQVTLGPTVQSLMLCMFVTGAHKIHADGSATFFQNTNLGLAPGAGTDLKGGGTLTGTLYADPSAYPKIQSSIRANPAGNSDFHVLGGIVQTPLAQAVADVTNAYNLAKMLIPNSTVGSVKNNTTFTNASGTPNGFGGKNTVYKVNGEIALSGKTLTIQGNANDWFIINVVKNIHVQNKGHITLTGGIPASHVLFTVGDHEWDIKDAGTTAAGNFLAPKAGQEGELDKGASLVGGAFGNTIHTSGGAKFTGDCYQQVPVPGTAMLIGLGGLIAARRRRA